MRDKTIGRCGNLTSFTSLRPRALIFHTSRCGSTLFAKALGRPPANVVMNQPGPLQHGFWSMLTNAFTENLVGNDRNLDDFRKLVSLMSQRRQPEQEMVFVKFISWNVVYIDFIMRAFPGTPAIFLYRDPVEIIASVRKSATAVLEAKNRVQAELLTGLPRWAIDRIGPTEYLARCYRRSFETVSAWNQSDLSLLDYSELTADRFPSILARAFDYRPAPPVLEDMRAEFGAYSKDDSGSTTFADDRAGKRSSISEADRRLISRVAGRQLDQLRRDPRNLFPPRFLGTRDHEALTNQEPALSFR